MLKYGEARLMLQKRSTPWLTAREKNLRGEVEQLSLKPNKHPDKAGRGGRRRDGRGFSVNLNPRS